MVQNSVQFCTISLHIWILKNKSWRLYNCLFEFGLLLVTWFDYYIKFIGNLSIYFKSLSHTLAVTTETKFYFVQSYKKLISVFRPRSCPTGACGPGPDNWLSPSPCPPYSATPFQWRYVFATRYLIIQGVPIDEQFYINTYQHNLLLNNSLKSKQSLKEMIVLLGTDLFTHEHFFSIRHQKVPGPHQENPSPTGNNRTYKSNVGRNRWFQCIKLWRKWAKWFSYKSVKCYFVGHFEKKFKLKSSF